MSDITWEFNRPFGPPDARELIDREGFKEAVEAYMLLDRQLRQAHAYWLADHRGFSYRKARAEQREHVATQSKEIGRRVVLLHVVNRAVYGVTT